MSIANNHHRPSGISKLLVKKKKDYWITSFPEDI